MTNSLGRSRTAPVPAPGARRRRVQRRAHRRVAALLGLLVGLVAAVIVAGCLPSAARGEGSGAAASGLAGSGTAAPPVVTPSPRPTGPTPRPSFVPPTPTPEPTFLVYTVARGDSLNAIAHRFGTTARSIAFWNRSTYPSLDPESAGYKPNFLKLGWTLFVRPNDVVDEQDLPEPSASSGDPSGAAATDGVDGADAAPSDDPAAEPSDSADPG